MTDRILTTVGWLAIVLLALAAGRLAAVSPGWDGYLIWAAIAGVVCAAIYLSGVWREATAASAAAAVDARRRSMLPIVGALAAVLVVNVLAGRYAPRWDVTSGRIHQPAAGTRAALRALDAPVRMHVFAREADIPALRDRLDEYEAASPLLDVEYVDVNAPDVLSATEAAVADSAPGQVTAILEYKGRAERISARSEQELTNALTRLREGRTRKAYFTTGHAERDTTSTERAGYSGAAAALRRENFAVETINIARDGDIPPDATLVVSAGPRVDFFRAEIDALRRYLDAGGSILFLIDPFEDLKRYITESGNALFMMDPSSVSSAGELRNLTAFTAELGADLGNDVVVDASERGQFLGTDASVPVVTTYPPHQITRTLTSLTAFPMARTVTPAAGAHAAMPILQTGDRTWSERDIQQLAGGRPSMDEAKGDRPGPVSLGVAVSRPPVLTPAATRTGAPLDPLRSLGAGVREPRAVVVGDSDFVANYSANVPGNRELFLSIANWLAQEKPVVIPSRTRKEIRLEMTASQQRLASAIALLLLPAIAFGMASYLRRQATEPASRAD